MNSAFNVAALIAAHPLPPEEPELPAALDVCSDCTVEVPAGDVETAALLLVEAGPLLLDADAPPLEEVGLLLGADGLPLDEVGLLLDAVGLPLDEELLLQPVSAAASARAVTSSTTPGVLERDCPIVPMAVHPNSASIEAGPPLGN